MKSTLFQTAALVFAGVLSLAPLSAFAAFNDVTLTTDAVISVGGYTLNVSGSSAAIQSIVVSSGSFSVSLASGSSFKVSSPTLNQLSSDVTSDVTSNICTGSASSITVAYSGAGTVTNVITPLATLCGNAQPARAPSSGGGGAIFGSGPLAPGYVNTNATTTTAAPVSTTTTPAISAPTPTTTASTLQFDHNLQFQDRSEEVRMLQAFLNAHGARVASSGSGSAGSETDYFGTLTFKALVSFQNANAEEILTPLGLSEGTGFFGPATRMYINSLP